MNIIHHPRFAEIVELAREPNPVLWHILAQAIADNDPQTFAEFFTVLWAADAVLPEWLLWLAVPVFQKAIDETEGQEFDDALWTLARIAEALKEINYVLC